MSEHSPKEKLLPCPWCGSDNLEVFLCRDGDRGVIEYVQCMDCTSCGPDHKEGRHWNKQKDAVRLNSNTILIHGRDEFGEPTSCIHTGLDLRVAIDAAMEQKS